jgi:hypothetical protein
VNEVDQRMCVARIDEISWIIEESREMPLHGRKQPFSLEQDSPLDHNRRYTSRVRRWDELIALDHAKPFMRCQI